MKLFVSICKNEECKHKDTNIVPVRKCEKCGSKCDVYA